ncbi:bifunctional copper resistance protein CopD/cytochrome c oxidase assembly protein [Corynebacterium sanguinis]|uniref:Copper resistance protein n=1 Tax=Corynebacterium sanguinis TaxID=2594913 RepID=A0A6C1TWB7_9CORY|nr:MULTISPECIES: cytochrome c oxidase assembly protein [Corynebacterium]MBA4506209.1 bifunctional copper resistance protein CopD/cytochrome c oxidase assembly protein [Corynebacterium sanguinis]MCT1414531.1 bifunctional copper resistance protein CopD/cytochrome c oxidase assembly protein [Corynebacterium sanguinis]MCT1426306.1 bifunctional copper resistance protein CopD/cytochrome c oxidase assembly protein [Corynebacterium sanguinis]MCT1464148.1 bifunctional copper resistance protein CopD/cyto
MSHNGSHTRQSTAAVKVAWPFYGAALLVAALVAGTVATLFSNDSLAALGIPDPGIVTIFGLPALRATAWMCAALAAGSFLFSAFLIPPRRTGEDLNGARLSVDGVIAARTAGWASLSVCLIALLMIPLVLSDVSGTPLSQVLFAPSAWATALEQVADAQVWLGVAAIAGVVGVVALTAHSWWAQVALLIGSLVTIMPLGLTGHSATGGDHDYGTNSFLWHLVFMLLWIGALMALVAYGRRLGPHLESAARRYSQVALFSFLVMLISGLINASIRVRPEDLLQYNYGLVLIAKTVALLVLGLLGYAHRSITIPRLGTDRGAFTRLAAVEVLVMAAVTGVAVTLGRTPPPPPRTIDLSEMELQMGYNLNEPLTVTNWLGQWRFELLYSVIALLLALYYLHLVRRVDGWRHTRTAWWLLGCATIVVTLSSGVGMHMPASYSAHMIVHMILSMAVPVLLVLGAPLTLVAAAYPAGEFNPRMWVESFQRSRFLRVITWPPVSLAQFVFFFYILYISIPLYELMISEHAGHVIMNGVFLLSGYFYFWELIGPDHIEGRASAKVRLAWLWVSMPIHLFMGVYLMQLGVIMGEDFYNSLNLPWDPDLLADQKAGGGIAWASGSFPLTVVFAVLFYLWWREDKTETRELDRRAEETDDEEWRRYNEMLAQYTQSGGGRK